MNAKQTGGPAPLVPGGWPVVGHTHKFVRDPLGLLFEARKACGDVARLRLLGKDLVLFTGPAAHEAVFRMPDDKLSQAQAYKMMTPVFGKGIVYDTTPERMKEQLGMLRPALQPARMKLYGEIVAGEVALATSTWADEGVIDLYAWCQTLTSFTSSHCLLGREFRNEMSEQFARVYHDLERGIVPIGYINPYLPIPAFRKRDAARAKLGEMVAQIVEARRRSGYRGEDFLQTLMESTYADGTPLTDHEITGLLVAAMFAGHHTSSVTTAWTVLELLSNPEFLAEVRQEADAVLDDGTVDMPKLRALEKTEWAVREALRIHPPLFILIRAVMEDVELLGYRVPKGAWVAVSPTVAHQIDEVFPRADRFDPHRYSPERQEDANPMSYIAFGGGRHKCLGNAFALLQIKTIVGLLLRDWDLELYGDELVADIQSLVIGPRMPCRVRYKRRSRA
jgi:sterol 14-demethylase